MMQAYAWRVSPFDSWGLLVLSLWVLEIPCFTCLNACYVVVFSGAILVGCVSRVARYRDRLWWSLSLRGRCFVFVIHLVFGFSVFMCCLYGALPIDE